MRRDLFGYTEGFYNPRRLHSALGYISPRIWSVEQLNPIHFVGVDHPMKWRVGEPERRRKTQPALASRRLWRVPAILVQPIKDAGGTGVCPRQACTALPGLRPEAAQEGPYDLKSG